MATLNDILTLAKAGFNAEQIGALLQPAQDPAPQPEPQPAPQPEAQPAQGAAPRQDPYTKLMEELGAIKAQIQQSNRSQAQQSNRSQAQQPEPQPAPQPEAQPAQGAAPRQDPYKKLMEELGAIKAQIQQSNRSQAQQPEPQQLTGDQVLANIIAPPIKAGTK